MPEPPAEPEVPRLPDWAGQPTVTSPATTTDQLLANNAGFAEETLPERLTSMPELKVAIVTCMDCRIDVSAVLGLASGQAHVLRNAGGVVTDDVIRSLAISQRKLGTREIMLIHHTDCGMQKITDDAFRAELEATTGTTPPWAIESFTDVESDVRQSILRVQRSEFIPHRDVVRGFVLDVDVHRLVEITL